MNCSLIIEVINALEEAGKDRKVKSVEDFRLWLNEKSYERERPSNIYDVDEQHVFDLENEIAKQVILLCRFTKQTIRKGLCDYPEIANEEFTYLYRLMDYDSVTKMQLVEKNAHEKQTGMVIIKRLISYGLVEEFPDEHDKRTKRVKITNKGRTLFHDSLQQVTEIARILSAKLKSEEKSKLLELLKKLNQFHFMVYLNHKNSNVSEINALIV